MAKPTLTLAEWGTDTNIATGTEAGTPTKVDPGSAYRKQGGVPGLNFVAPYWNWVLNQLYQWAAYVDAGAWVGTHTWGAASINASTGDLVATTVHTTSSISSENNIGAANSFVFVDTSGTITGRTRTKMIPVVGGISSQSAGVTNWSASIPGVGGNFYLASGVANGVVGYPLQLPNLALITQIRAVVKHGTSPTSVPIFMDLLKQQVNKASAYAFNATTSGGSATAVTGTARQLLGTGAITMAVHNDQYDYLLVFYGSDHSGDQICWIEVTFIEFTPAGNDV